MTALKNLNQKFATNLLSTKEQKNLKGKGMGNMYRMEGKNCPPPVGNGKKEIKDKFL